jgi:hypothetical protein
MRANRAQQTPPVAAEYYDAARTVIYAVLAFSVPLQSCARKPGIFAENA